MEFAIVNFVLAARTARIQGFPRFDEHIVNWQFMSTDGKQRALAAADECGLNLATILDEVWNITSSVP